MAPAQGPLGWERLKTWMSNVNHFVTVKRPQPVCATFFHFLILNNSCLWLSEFSLWTDISASYMIGFGWFQPGRESSYCIKHQVSVHSHWKMPPVWLINSDLEITSTFWELDCTSTLSPEWSYNSWHTGRFGHTHTHTGCHSPPGLLVFWLQCAPPPLSSSLWDTAKRRTWNKRTDRYPI